MEGDAIQVGEKIFSLFQLNFIYIVPNPNNSYLKEMLSKPDFYWGELSRMSEKLKNSPEELCAGHCSGVQKGRAAIVWCKKAE